MAACWIPLLVVTWKSPEPDAVPDPPQTLKQAVWEPFLGFLAQHRALEILAFVVLYKLSDNLTQALTRPFLVQVGFDATDVGVVTGTISLRGDSWSARSWVGCSRTPSAWGARSGSSGFFQIFSNLGYALVAHVGPNKPIMYAAVAFELGSTGLGSGAFGVLLLRLTQKRFSATQFALLSSLFSISRVLAGPPAGLLADAIGWRDFFILTVFTGIPGLLMLHRFVPWGVREIEFQAAGPAVGQPLGRRELAARAALGGVMASAAGVLTTAVLWGIRSFRDHTASTSCTRSDRSCGRRPSGRGRP
jgi:PAT family beta-lactamase induction signal transducer AmpG